MFPFFKQIKSLAITPGLEEEIWRAAYFRRNSAHARDFNFFLSKCQANIRLLANVNKLSRAKSYLNSQYLGALDCSQT